MLTIETRAGRVAYEELGTGMPLVLLSANPGDHHHFDSIVPRLSRSFRTIALDWPGYGNSFPVQPTRQFFTNNNQHQRWREQCAGGGGSGIAVYQF